MTRNFALSCLLVATLAVIYTDGLAVMSVDLGSEFMKVAIVKPGVPMEIAINSESRRKTNVVVGMRSNERTFGDAAMSTAVKYPEKAYWYLQDLLGKTLDNPMVQLYQKRFPYYKMHADPDTSMPLFQHDDETVYHPEELLAMILEQARETASNFAEQPVTEAVITVPVFFNQVERRALLRAADMIDLKVLQLMNAETAVALNYGVFRRKNFNATESHYLFFNMGAGSTTATVVGYQLVKTKSPAGVSETVPQLAIKGIGFDRTLGGVEFNLRLRDHLAKAFNENKKTTSDLYSNKRSMSKLYKESIRLKHVLSANVEHRSQIEGLLDDEDFKLNVKREDFEGMSEDLFARIAAPVEEAMKMSEVTWDEISEVILMGGGTRMPRVKQELQKVIKREELGQGINTDEAAALGAVYQAAHLSKGFRVKKFAIKEATLYPIQVEFEKVRTDSDDTLPKRVVKRVLFNRGNPYPQKKVMTFNKHVKDFTFEVNHGEMDFLGEDRMSAFGETKLQKVSLNGVEPAYFKHKDTSEPKGIKTHFRMDESGLLVLEKSEAIYEREPVVEGADEEESTLKKLGSFFFGSDQKEETEGDVDGSAKAAADGDSDGTEPPTTNGDAAAEKATDSGKASSEEDGKKADDDKETEEKTPEEVKEEVEKKSGETKEGEESQSEREKDESTADSESTKTDSKGDGKDDSKTDSKEDGGKDGEKKGEKGDGKSEEEKKKEEEEKKKNKKTTIKEAIQTDMIHVDGLEPSKENLKLSKQKIVDLRKRDTEKRELEAAKNDLETYIFDLQDKLYQELYEQCSTEEERDSLRAELSEASDWLYEQEDSGKKVFQDKLKTLKASSADLFYRVDQVKERPRALEALFSAVNYSEHFLVTMKNFTGEDQPFTEVEYNKMAELINETKEWNSTFVVEMINQPLTEKPKTTIEDIARKITDIDREVKYLINKAKRFTPKVKAPETNTTQSKPDSKKKTKIDPDNLDDLPEGVKVVKLNPDGSGMEGINIGGKNIKINPDGTIDSGEAPIDGGEKEKEGADTPAEEEGATEEEPETLQLGDGTTEEEDLAKKKIEL